MGLINDRVGTEKTVTTVTTVTKELPELLTKVKIVDGFFHMVKGKASHMYLVTDDGEAIVMPVAEDYEIGLVSSAQLKETLKEFAEDIDKLVETGMAEKKHLNILAGGK
jgi:hypothetical protein